MLRAIDKLEPFQKAISKAHLASAGVSIDSLDHKPLIAVANSWNEICPGHEPLKQLAEEVKKGILEAGGEPIEFNTVAMCDGIAQGHSGGHLEHGSHKGCKALKKPDGDGQFPALCLYLPQLSAVSR